RPLALVRERLLGPGHVRWLETSNDACFKCIVDVLEEFAARRPLLLWASCIHDSLKGRIRDDADNVYLENVTNDVFSSVEEPLNLQRGHNSLHELGDFLVSESQPLVDDLAPRLVKCVEQRARFCGWPLVREKARTSEGKSVRQLVTNSAQQA